jgi:hypothetical protein
MGWDLPKLLSGKNLPTQVVFGTRWYDTSVDPPVQRFWDGTQWVVVERITKLRAGISKAAEAVQCPNCGVYPPQTGWEPQPIADQVKQTFTCQCGHIVERFLSIHE